MKRFLFNTMLMILTFIVAETQPLYSTGACCAISKSASGKPNLTFIASSAWSHEKIEGKRYNLVQHALMLRGNYPLTEWLILNAQIGTPFKTKLSDNAIETQGNLGMIYGGGIGFVPLELLESVEFFTSISYSQSRGYLTKHIHRDDIDKVFFISEIQAVLLGDYSISNDVALYGGIRLYYGKNELRDNRTRNILSGNREGNAAPLFGVRYSPSENFRFTAEGGFGHTNVVSVGLIVSFE